MKPVTLEDIAKIAGVSLKTVSRVVNNEKYVSKDTREKVLKLLVKHNYIPNLAAKSLVSKRTQTLGLIVPNLENPFYSRLLRGVVQTAESNNFGIIISESKFDIKIGEKYLRTFIERGVDGILIATLDLDTNIIHTLNRIKKPFVLMTCYVDNPKVHCVIADDYKAGRKVVNYIIKFGHRNIAFLKGPNVYSSNERFRAYIDVMRENNLEIKDYFITEEVLDEISAYNVSFKLLNKYNDITAIVANNDYVAIGAMKAINELGLKIPDDISVIGYDDIEVASLLRVPLTTIHYPNFHCGKVATEILIKIINDEIDVDDYKVEILKTHFVERQSCGPVKVFN